MKNIDVSSSELGFSTCNESAFKFVQSLWKTLEIFVCQKPNRGSSIFSMQELSQLKAKFEGSKEKKTSQLPMTTK